MKNTKRKFSLHWQILIALTLSVVYGIVFSTSYRTDKIDTSALHLGIHDDQVISSVNSLSTQQYKSISEIKLSLKKILTAEQYKLYSKTIVELSYYNPAIKAISWMGTIFLRLLKMLVIPLILFSIISGISNISAGKDLRRLSLKTFSYYVATSALAITVGLILVNIFKPGIGVNYTPLDSVDIAAGQQSLGDILTGIVPENIIEAMAQNQLLPVIFFSIIVGIFITRIDSHYCELLKNFFNAGFELFMKITLFVIKLAPFGIFGLVAKVIADQDKLSNLMINLGIFTLTVLLALFIHSFISLPLITKFFGKARPFKHFSNMSTALLTAFSTASSSATLPFTLENVENNSGVSKKISNFTIPIGATVNMDGTAIYICAVIMFIAQAKGVHLNFQQQFILVITTLLASIGAAGIPMGSLILISIILTTLGLPLEMIALILPVDRILDMFRTATNVWSDSCGAVVIAKTEGEILNV
ncbi:MAG: dicarboxylate/amino acid:cation symporter [Bacteroidales bacterium]|nr:dicarboxylate/amino acid:cation symporter [Bacteroidales bacterium]